MSIEDFQKLREVISKERKISTEINSLEKYMEGAEPAEKKMIASQIALVKKTLRETNREIPEVIQKINLTNSLIPEDKNEERKVAVPVKNIPVKNIKVQEKETIEKPTSEDTSMTTAKGYTLKQLRPTQLEKLTLKRIKKPAEKKEIQKEKKASIYIKTANKFFSGLSEKIVSEKTFDDLEKDLIKGNLQFTPRSYISVIFLTTCIALGVGLLFGVFFFFFNIGSALPIVTPATGKITGRLLKLVLITIFTPIITFVIMYSYPDLKKLQLKQE